MQTANISTTATHIAEMVGDPMIKPGLLFHGEKTQRVIVRLREYLAISETESDTDPYDQATLPGVLVTSKLTCRASGQQNQMKHMYDNFPG